MNIPQPVLRSRSITALGVCVLVFCLGTSLPGLVEERTWVDREGRTLEAALAGWGEDAVYVTTSDGRTFPIELEQLSAECRAYLETLRRPSLWEEPDGVFHRIPAGKFDLGDHENSLSHSLPQHRVWVGEFYMEAYPVTYAQWQEVVAWATHPDRGKRRYDFEHEGRRGGGGRSDKNHPVTSINWYDAMKWANARSEKEGRDPVYFEDGEHLQVYRSGRLDLSVDKVRWSAHGYRLPTEAEWEKAARGGLEGKRYPWGDGGVSPARANYWNSTERNGTTPVGSFGKNGFGLYDMAGNVWEWTWNRWGDYQPEQKHNPTGHASASHRVTRGGSWSNAEGQLRVAWRRVTHPTNSYPRIGLRVVVSGPGWEAVD